MPRYKASILYEVKDGSSRPGDIVSSMSGQRTRGLDIELDADNRHHAERLIKAQYNTRKIKLLTEITDRQAQQKQQKSSRSSKGNSDLDDAVKSVSHSAGQALGEAVKRGGPSGCLRSMIFIGIGIVVAWLLF